MGTSRFRDLALVVLLLSVALPVFASPVPTGSVSISIDGTVISGEGSVGLNSSGQASLNNYNVGSLVNGAHIVSVSYSGDSNYLASTGTATFTITPTQQASQVTVTVSPTTPAPGGYVSISITVGPAS